jgi:hypothetical protein
MVPSDERLRELLKLAQDADPERAGPTTAYNWDARRMWLRQVIPSEMTAILRELLAAREVVRAAKQTRRYGALYPEVVIALAAYDATTEGGE